MRLAAPPRTLPGHFLRRGTDRDSVKTRMDRSKSRRDNEAEVPGPGRVQLDRVKSPPEPGGRRRGLGLERSVASSSIGRLSGRPEGGEVDGSSGKAWQARTSEGGRGRGSDGTHPLDERRSVVRR